MKRQLELFPKPKRLTLADIKEIVRLNAPTFHAAYYGGQEKQS